MVELLLCTEHPIGTGFACEEVWTPNVNPKMETIATAGTMLSYGVSNPSQKHLGFLLWKSTVGRVT